VQYAARKLRGAPAESSHPLIEADAAHAH